MVKGGPHPLNLLEIVSDVNFRKEYNLKDGDEIKIEIWIYLFFSSIFSSVKDINLISLNESISNLFVSW